MTTDRTPPAALDIAVCLAEQDQTIADVKRQNTAMESRIHTLEGQFDFLDSFVGQLWTQAGRPHVVFSDEHERVRRGLPRHGAPIGPILKGVSEVGPESFEEFKHEHFFEGSGGGQ